MKGSLSPADPAGVDIEIHPDSVEIRTGAWVFGAELKGMSTGRAKRLELTPADKPGQLFDELAMETRNNETIVFLTLVGQPKVVVIVKVWGEFPYRHQQTLCPQYLTSDGVTWKKTPEGWDYIPTTARTALPKDAMRLRLVKG